MERYCLNCGNKLSQNEVCECQNEKTAFFSIDTHSMINLDRISESYDTVYKPTEDMSNFWKHVLDVIVDFFKDPFTQTTKVFKSKDYYVGLFLLIVQLSLVSVFSVLRIHDIIAFGINKSSMFDTTGLFNEASKLTFTTGNYSFIFFTTLLSYLTFTGGFIGILKLLTRSTDGFLSALASFGVSTLPVSFATLFSLLLFFLPISVFILIIFMAVIISIISCFDLIKSSLKIPDKWTFYCTILLIGVYYYGILHFSYRLI